MFPGLEPPSPWTSAGSPYCVVGGDLNIGFPLTIGPDVEVRVQGNYRITMSAPLTVIGPVELRADVVPRWKGLTLTAAGNSLQGLRIQDGGEGGLQLRLGATNTTLDSCVILDSVAQRGGGLSIQLTQLVSGNIRLRDCQFVRNRATVEGGGIFASLEATTLSIERCTVSDNTAAARR